MAANTLYLGPRICTAALANIIANPTFGTLISETGAGFTWQGNSQRNRLTQMVERPCDGPSFRTAIYIRTRNPESIGRRLPRQSAKNCLPGKAWRRIHGLRA